MECNMTHYEIAEISTRIGRFNEEQSALNRKMRKVAFEILNHCENRTLSFTDDENGDDFTISVPDQDGIPEVRLVNQVSIKKFNDAVTKQGTERIIITDDCDADWYVWEAGVSWINLLNFMRDEI